MNMIKNHIRRILSNYRIAVQRRYVLKVEGKNLSSLKLLSLTKQEKNLLKGQWGELGLSINDDFYKMYKTIDKFDPQYLSDDLYYPYILRKLNPIEYSVALCHKAFYDKLFPQTKLPITFVRRIRGVFYDCQYNMITEEDAKKIIINNKSFIIKPTIDTCVGKNVHKIINTAQTDLSELFRNVGQDFIVQEVVEQSNQTKKLNNTSLNTIRVSTLFLNGKFSVCSIIIKMGRNGSVVDNLGAGGLVIGVHNNGNLYNYAFDSMYNKHYHNGDCIFEGLKVDGIDKVKQFVEKLHISHLPHLSFVGWDVALNKDNEPVLIEVNLKWPGIQFEQLCCASPLFGERTNEVIEYCKQ